MLALDNQRMLPAHGVGNEIHKVMLVKIFCAKHDLLPELSPFRFFHPANAG